jgi:hypothetical protein
LLVEPQRTNLALYSSSFDTLPWLLGNNVGPATITANNAIAPDGTLTADKIAFPAVNTPSQWSLVFTPFTALAAAYSGSFYIKGELGTEVVWIAFTKDGVNYQRQICNLTTEWQRFDLSATLIVGADNFTIGVDTRDSSQTARPAQTIYLWGAQLELGSYPTSYIPTTSAAVTRNADVISKTGISSLIGQTEGTLFIDIVFKNPLTSINRFMSITEAGWQADGSIRIEMNTSELTVDIVNNGSSIGAITYLGTFTPNTRYKIAVAYKQNDCQMYFNGINAGSDTSTGVMPACFQLYLNALGGGFNAPYEASNINVAALWKTRLTNAQLAQLTTI